MTKPETEKLPEPAFRLKWDSMRAAYYVSKPNVGDTDVYTADQMRQYAGEVAAQAVIAATVAMSERLRAQGGGESCQFFASGPEGSFFTKTLAEAQNLLDFAGFDCDEWTVTDLHDPTGTTPRDVATPDAAPDAVCKDAERFRWLAENCRPWPGGDDEPHALIQVCRGELPDGEVGWFNIIGPVSRVGIITLDAAVDAAIAHARSAGGERNG